MMKIKDLTRIALAAIATLIYTIGCTEEASIPVSQNKAQMIIASIDNTHAETKTCIEAYIGNNTPYVAILWTPEDELGVFTDEEQNIKYTKANRTKNEEVASFVPSETISGTPQFAYYPYNESAGIDPTNLAGNIPEIQTMDPVKKTLPGDFKIGQYHETTTDGDQFRFAHLFCPVRIIISGAETSVSADNLIGIDLTVTRNGVAVPVSGNFTFNAQTGTYTLGQTSNSITFDWTSHPSLSTQAQAFGTVLPEIKVGDVMTFVIRTSNHTATLSVNAKVDFKANTLYTFPLTLKNYKDNITFESNGNSGNTGGDSGNTEGVVVASGTFTAATYNVDGLPEKVSFVTINDDGPGSTGTKSISSMISVDNWDFVAFSEDFAYHTELTSAMSAWTFGKYRGNVSTEALYSTIDTDGLGFATRNAMCSFSNEKIVEFTSDYGGLTSGANTCIKKGFRHYVMTLADGIEIDVLITHMNTYSSSGSGHINAQHAQLKQMAQYVNSIRGNKRPIIIMGDTNCRYTRHDFQTYFWSVLNNDLVAKDPWVDFYWDGVYPTYPSKSLMVSDATGTNSETDIICENTQKGEVVDKIIYINNPESDVQIEARSYLRDYDGYNGLADHMPIVVDFYYEKRAASKAAGTVVGVDSWDEYIDIL